MKSSVDLTENLDFRFKAKDLYVEQKNNSIFHNLSFDRFNVPKDEFFIFQDKGAILQGNADSRRTKIYNTGFCDKKTCDCCGAKLWVYDNDTLCRNCYERMYITANIKDVLT